MNFPLGILRGFSPQRRSFRQVWNAVSHFSRGIPLSWQEGKDVYKLASLVNSIKRGDVLELQISGDEAVITYYPKYGSPKQEQISSRLVKVYVQSFYDKDLSLVEGQPKYLLTSYFGKKVPQK